jgi:hypothetical protein
MSKILIIEIKTYKHQRLTGRLVGNSEGFRVGVDVGESVTVLNRVHRLPFKHSTPPEGDSPPLTVKSVLALGSFVPVHSPGTHSKRSNESPPFVVHLILPFHPSGLGPDTWIPATVS